MLNNVFSINWFDICLLILIIYFLITNDGFIAGVLDILGLILSFFFSFKFYSFFGNALSKNLIMTKGLANVAGFFIVWFLTEILFFILTKFILKRIPGNTHKSKINRVLGWLPAGLQAFFFASFITTLIIALPIRGSIKKSTLDSMSGPILMSFSQKLESKLKPVFNDAIIETLNFITIKPTSDQTIDLQIKVKSSELKPDPSAELAMFKLVNNERISAGLKPLKFDSSLKNAGRQYADEMLLNSFFSHYSKIDGSSPAERLDNSKIDYLVTGENLAFAPDVQIAHTGLMNSEGHRKNILSEEFGRVGIGVIDAGVYGKMFVQEFTN